VHERPARIEDDDLIAVLRAQWQLAPAGMRYLPVGFGGYHWLATDTAGSRWFVTVNELPDHGSEPGFASFAAAMQTAASLVSDAGLDFVVAPVRTLAGHAAHRLGPGYAVTVFPYCEGEPSSFGDLLTGPERAAVTGMLAALHNSTTTLDTRTVPVRSLQLAERAVVNLSLRERGAPWPGGPLAEPARAALAEHWPDLVRALGRFDALVAAVGNDGRSLVITHGEPHPGNLVRAADHLMLVDWDTVGLAPPERDLWWICSGTGQQPAGYAELTGREVSREALALYRLRWTLDDISLFLAELRAPHERTADTEVSFAGFRDGLRSLAAI
jgi:spectinomycin phosphotransferase